MPQFEQRGNFDNGTVSLNATHYDGESEYNLHNLYGLMMTKRTYNFLKEDATYGKQKETPFILTRSTTSTSGKYASHWLGDNWRNWQYLRYSVSGILSMNMFGVPHTGADVCGFFGKERDDELCARWVQLATFYPLARFHYDKDSDMNEPYLVSEEPYKDMVHRAMHDRYQYLREMYTCMAELSFDKGFDKSIEMATCWDPLFYHYPTDDKVYNTTDSSFLVHGAIKVTPILTSTPSATFDSYFPSGVWVDLQDPMQVI